MLSHKLVEFEDPHPPFSSKMADKVASFGGSWKFIILFLMAMLIWIALNIGYSEKIEHSGLACSAILTEYTPV